MAQTPSTMMLPLGAKAPAFELKDAAGHAHSLAGFEGSSALSWPSSAATARS